MASGSQKDAIKKNQIARRGKTKASKRNPLRFKIKTQKNGGDTAPF